MGLMEILFRTPMQKQSPNALMDNMLLQTSLSVYNMLSLDNLTWHGEVEHKNTNMVEMITKEQITYHDSWARLRVKQLTKQTYVLASH